MPSPKSLIQEFVSQILQEKLPRRGRASLPKNWETGGAEIEAALKRAGLERLGGFSGDEFVAALRKRGYSIVSAGDSARVLGDGSEGIVFDGVDRRGKRVAIKYLWDHAETDHYIELQGNIARIDDPEVAAIFPIIYDVWLHQGKHTRYGIAVLEHLVPLHDSVVIGSTTVSISKESPLSGRGRTRENIKTAVVDATMRELLKPGRLTGTLVAHSNSFPAPRHELEEIGERAEEICVDKQAYLRATLMSIVHTTMSMGTGSIYSADFTLSAVNDALHKAVAAVVGTDHPLFDADFSEVSAAHAVEALQRSRFLDQDGNFSNKKIPLANNKFAASESDERPAPNQEVDRFLQRCVAARESEGIQLADMHGDNLMQRPATGEIVLADFGYVRFA